ncbi:MAG TPA: MBL fold metallo-hydrolase [Gemmatimonadaceae bacterium]|nr:MBL fold metallo-hydrolase [Gemmatimonadaceae bacterium]
MQVEILGTRGNIPLSSRAHARHSGILIDDRLLLDLGESSYLRRRPTHIFITHLHPDHAALSRRDVALAAETYVPELCRAIPEAKVISGPVRAGAHRVVPVPTRHSVHVRSVGYVVEKGRRRIFYSSDLFSIHPRYRSRLGRLDLVITDGSFIRRGGLVRVDAATGRRFGHAGIPDLVAFFSPFTRRIVITHFGGWFYSDIAASRRRIAALSDGARVTAARDGMVVVV